MTKKRLFLLSISTFFLINQGAFAWGGYTASPTYYNTNLPSIFDGYTLHTDYRMANDSLYGYRGDTNYCTETVTRTLSLGSEGEDVAQVQDYLFNQDFLQSQPNGHYGYATRNAIKLFQSRYALPQTGTIGQKTMNVLNELMCGGDTTTLAPATVSPVTDIATTRLQNQNTPLYQNQNQVVLPTIVPQNSSTLGTPLSSYSPTPNSVFANTNYANQNVYPVTVNRAPTVTIVIPLNKSFYKEGDTIPVTWVTSNMTANRYALMIANTSTGLEKQIAALPGDLKQYNVTLTKELLNSVCAGTTACTGLNSNAYRMYVVAYYQTIDGELSIRAYADQMTIDRPEALALISLTASKNPVVAGDSFKLYAYVPSTSAFTQYQNLYWKIRPICPSTVSLSVNGQGCGSDVYVYQANMNATPDITVTVNGNLWGPTQVTFEATAYAYYGGQELGRATTVVLVNK